MASRYALAVVFTLNDTVLPRFTLMSVANPWIVASPEPTTSHSVDGAPVFWFSQAMRFGPPAAHARGPMNCAAAATTSIAATHVRRTHEDTDRDMTILSSKAT